MIELENVSFVYAGDNKGGVKNISLKINKGEVVVLCGESGCGKTTITRLINGLIPNFYEGELTGSVKVNGKVISNQPLYDTARFVGSVFQNPRSQFFNVDTTSEIAFGCENFGLTEEKINERIDKTVREFNMEKLMGRNIFHLSGGEKQKIACASVAAMEPEILVMDEPSSNLDVNSIMELRNIFKHWKEKGKTIIVSEHRLFYLQGLADHFLYICDGQIMNKYTGEEFEKLKEEEREKMGLRKYTLNNIKADKHKIYSNEKIQLNDFKFSLKNNSMILSIEDCEIPAGGITAIIGRNGAGKSTFARCFCGLEKNKGTIIFKNKKMKAKDRLNICYMVMQEVNHQLFTESVSDEIQISMNDDKEKVKEDYILEQLDLLKYKGRHPMSLSGGQKQRVAIASAIASNRSILFFDEPTSGLDYRHMKKVASLLKKLQESGKIIYVITHDPELIMDCCTDVIHFEDGRIVDQYPVDEEGTAKIRRYFLV
ncbi:ABC transporter ATP-binding protein [uncultured Clostridium sp.]|uniref:ABC transporter ATP-binding protein n=1 Tax=uncultured Clostridium sp. TaxID=59620 RepID=UPI0025D4E1E2|nr:energy-coupling factor ABC transporter ATP-binding protein [uncultured Clostridium sp.]